MEKGKEILHQPLHPPISEQRFATPKPNNGGPAPPISSLMAEDSTSKADVLTREEVLRRRSRRLKRLKRIYSEQYWALAEEIRVKHRDFYWQFGKSPLEDEDDALGLEFREKGGEDVGERKKCRFSGCKLMAMPLTVFCHQHIMSDKEQKLYKSCYFVIRSAQNGQITCRKPVSSMPSLCPVHFQKTQRRISDALRKAGLNASTTAKFHEIIHEFVRQIKEGRGRKQKCRGKSVTQEGLNRTLALDSAERTYIEKMIPSCGVSITSITTRRDIYGFARKQVEWQSLHDSK